MNKLVLGIFLAAIAAALSAQPAELTTEQQAAKCAAEGGCEVLTREQFMQFIQRASEAAFMQGLKACRPSI